MKFLIIGAGMIGRVHAQALTELSHTFSVCDYNREFAEKLKNDFGADQAFTDYQTAVLKSGAQVAIICTPNHLHADPAIFAMEHGMDVLCEKPMASSFEDARRIYEAQQKTGRKLMVGYIVRCYPALDYVKKKVEEGVLGTVISARCILAAPETLDVAKTTYRKSYETGGGIIYDYTHEIDYCRYLLGEPDQVAAFCGSHIRKDQTVDDNADMLFHFAGDVVLELHMDYVQYAGYGTGRSIQIIGDKGCIECDFKKCVLTLYDGTVEEVSLPADWPAPFKTQIGRMEAIEEGKDIPYVTAFDGMRIIEIADKVYESARTARFVAL